MVNGNFGVCVRQWLFSLLDISMASKFPSPNVHIFGLFAIDKLEDKLEEVCESSLLGKWVQKEDIDFVLSIQKCHD